MKKIGNLNRFFFLVSLLTVFSLSKVWAQDVEVSATVNETVVFQGERIVLTIAVSGSKFKKISNPDLPELQGMRFLSLTPSTSTSFSFVNGVAKSSYSYSYYILTEKEGEFTIPPVSVSIDQKLYKTQALKVSIRSRSAAAKNPNASPDIFLKMELSNPKPYVGEQVLAKVVIYFKNSLEILSYQPTAGWKAEGFWKEELNDGKQPQVTSDIINGVSYRKAELMKYALFATKSGKLNLSPFTVVTTVRVASRNRDPFSSFFGGYGTNQRNIDLETDAVPVEVVSLPELNDAIFTGAVGNYKVSRSITKTSVVAGESIELATKIQGSGNIALVTKPKYEFPNTFEEYNPQESSDINRKSDIIKGVKTFSDIVIPRTPGTYTIHEVKYAFFNPTKKRFETTVLPAINLVVKKDPRAFASSSQQIPFEVQPVLGQTLWYSPEKFTVFKENWFIMMLAFPFVVGLALFFYRSYLDKMEGDVQFARSNKASRKTDTRFIAAKKIAESDIKASYAEIQKALIGYVADRLHIPETGQDEDIYIEELVKKGMEPEDIKKLNSLLQKCSTIRFAPLTSMQDFQNDFQIAQKLYKSIRGFV